MRSSTRMHLGSSRFVIVLGFCASLDEPRISLISCSGFSWRVGGFEGSGLHLLWHLAAPFLGLPAMSVPDCVLRSPMKTLAKALLRLDCLSHVLAWTKDPVFACKDAAGLDFVELPRLRMRFEAKADGPGGTVRCRVF